MVGRFPVEVLQFVLDEVVVFFLSYFSSCSKGKDLRGRRSDAVWTKLLDC